MYTLTQSYSSDGTLVSYVWTNDDGQVISETEALQGIANLGTILAAIANAMTTLTTIIDAAAVPATITTLPQAQVAVRQIQTAIGTLATNQRRLARFIRGDFSGTT